MEQTYTQSITTGINRFIGTITGGIVGYAALKLLLLMPYDHNLIRIVFLPFCILSVVYVCNAINRKESVSIGCVVVLVILSQWGKDTGNVFLYVVYRVTDTIVGIVIAALVNKFLDFGSLRTKHVFEDTGAETRRRKNQSFGNYSSKESKNTETNINEE
jgi:uncharacterized membrane protein YgaE (UPF0421/DUF939 family)